MSVIGRRAYNERSGRIVPNVLPAIILVDSNISDAGFTAFFSRASKRVTPQEKFTWDTDDFLPTTDTVTTAVTGTTATTVPVDNISYYIPNQLWMNKRTGEIYKIVSANTSTSNIEVERAVTALNSGGGTSAAAINAADTLVRLGPVVGESNRRQTVQTTTPSEVYNYTQAMRWELELSERQRKRAFVNNDELDYQQKKIMKQARKDMEGMFIDGERGRWTDGTMGDITTTAGMRSVITTNNYAVGGVLYESSFDEWLIENALRYGSRNKVMFASTKVILAITEIAKGRLSYHFQSFGGKKGEIGCQVLSYMAPNGGELLIVESRYLSDTHNGDAFICDMGELKRVVFSGNGVDGDLHVRSNTNDNDDFGFAAALYADMGLEYGVEKFHAKLSGVNGGSQGSSAL